MSSTIVILSGMTASGKSAVALEFARRHRDVEILNADSIQIYRGLNIGSAKPSPEERAEIPHQLLDLRNPDQPFTAGDFRREVETCLTELAQRGKRALIVGGTGFYLRALRYGMWQADEADPGAKEAFRETLADASNGELQALLAKRDAVSAARIPVGDRYRLVRALEIIHFTGKTPEELESTLPSSPDPRFSLFVLDRPKDELAQRIDVRARGMLAAGLVDETRHLLRAYPEARPLRSVGYAQVADHLAGKLPAGRKRSLTEADLIEEIALATRQLCKRQRTWFRSEAGAEWFELERDRELLMRRMDEIYSS